MWTCGNSNTKLPARYSSIVQGSHRVWDDTEDEFNVLKRWRVLTSIHTWGTGFLFPTKHEMHLASVSWLALKIGPNHLCVVLTFHRSFGFFSLYYSEIMLMTLRIGISLFQILKYILSIMSICLEWRVRFYIPYNFHFIIFFFFILKGKIPEPLLMCIIS